MYIYLNKLTHTKTQNNVANLVANLTKRRQRILDYKKLVQLTSTVGVVL